MRDGRAYSKRGFATFLPLKITLVYILVTFTIAVLGPVQYVDFNKGRTVLFIGAVSVSIIIGYAIGTQSMASFRPPSAPRKPSRTLALFDVSLGFALLALAWAMLSTVMSGSLNTSLLLLGETYINSYEGYNRNTGVYSLTFLLYSLSLPFSLIASVWGIFYFFKLDKRRRLLTLLLVVGGLLFYVVGTGKQKQVGDVLIYLIAIGAVKYGIQRRPLGPKLVFQAVLGVIVATAAFVAILSQRYAAINVGAFNINRSAHPRMTYDIDHPIFNLFGAEYGFALSVFSSYLSQGYYGLSLALGIDGDWTRMVGFSYSLSVIFNRFLGFEWQWPKTIVYQVGATTGWGESKWHTAFSHFASDFTWPGTALLFGFFAFIYARCWLFSIRYGNPYAILMFTVMTLGMFFLPANNQLFHSPGATFSLFLVAVLYVRAGHFQFNNLTKYRDPRKSNKVKIPDHQINPIAQSRP